MKQEIPTLHFCLHRESKEFIISYSDIVISFMYWFTSNSASTFTAVMDAEQQTTYTSNFVAQKWYDNLCSMIKWWATSANKPNMFIPIASIIRTDLNDVLCCAIFHDIYGNFTMSRSVQIKWKENLLICG